jgi:3-dehydroquinate synthase
LNFGHCFGHAIESATQYRIPHGQAVVIGMIIANSISEEKGLISQEKKKSLDVSLLFPLLKSDYKILKNIPADFVVDGMKQDKKRIGAGLPLILLHEDHTLEKITDLSVENAKQSYSKFIQDYC